MHQVVKKNDLIMYHRLELSCGARASKNRYSYEHNQNWRKDGMALVNVFLYSLLLVTDYSSKECK